MPVQASDLKDSASANPIAKRQEAWKAALPTDDTALWDWLTMLDETRRVALLGHCVSFGINALHEKIDRYGGGLSVHGIARPLGQANRLARVVGLDMVEAGWRPTVDNYLGRVPKLRILQAVREAKGEQSAQRRRPNGCSKARAGCPNRYGFPTSIPPRSCLRRPSRRAMRYLNSSPAMTSCPTPMRTSRRPSRPNESCGTTSAVPHFPIPTTWSLAIAPGSFFFGE
jgi:hypothetical protein